MDNEYTTVGTQTYVNPQTEVDETNSFIENFRNTQNTANAEIEQQTRALGSDLPASHGGLAGAEGAFVSQYQTPFTNTMVEGLKLTAQSDALNTAMSNYQSYLQDQYNQAYRNYAARQKAASSSSSSSGNNTTNGGANTSTTDQTTAVSIDTPEYTDAQQNNTALDIATNSTSMTLGEYVNQAIKDGRIRTEGSWPFQSANQEDLQKIKNEYYELRNG